MIRAKDILNSHRRRYELENCMNSSNGSKDHDTENHVHVLLWD